MYCNDSRRNLSFQLQNKKMNNTVIQKINELKKQIFLELIDIVGRVYIVVAYSDDVVIGKRGFLPQEKEKGLVLVFNSTMKFQIDDYAITATLIFNNKPEKCYIPLNAITSIFSPEVAVQLITPKFKTKPEKHGYEEKPAITEKDDKKIVNLSEIRKKK